MSKGCCKRFQSLFGRAGPGADSRHPIQLLFIGLDNAGKTTLTNYIAGGGMNTFSPTMQPNQHSGQFGDLFFDAIDLGGHAQVRRFWSDYCGKIDAVIFMVDCADATRLVEARNELRGFLVNIAFNGGIPTLVIGNKTDMASAVDEATLSAVLELNDVRSGKTPEEIDAAGLDWRLELFMCSIVEETGICEAFAWLTGVGDN